MGDNVVLFVLAITFSVANPDSPVSHFTHVAVKLLMWNNDMYKSLETVEIWGRIRNMMSVIGCKQDTGSRHRGPVSTRRSFKLSENFQMSQKLQKSLRKQTQIYQFTVSDSSITTVFTLDNTQWTLCS